MLGFPGSCARRPPAPCAAPSRPSAVPPGRARAGAAIRPGAGRGGGVPAARAHRTLSQPRRPLPRPWASSPAPSCRPQAESRANADRQSDAMGAPSAPWDPKAKGCPLACLLHTGQPPPPAPQRPDPHPHAHRVSSPKSSSACGRQVGLLPGRGEIAHTESHSPHYRGVQGARRTASQTPVPSWRPWSLPCPWPPGGGAIPSSPSGPRIPAL